MLNIRAYLEALTTSNETPPLAVLDPDLEPAATETRLLPRETLLAAATRRARETVVPKPKPPRAERLRNIAWANSYGQSSWERAWANLKPHERAWSSGGGQ